MKLGRANERAKMQGLEAILPAGAIVSFSHTRWRVVRVRGSTVTIEVIPPWYMRLLKALRVPRLPPKPR